MTYRSLLDEDWDARPNRSLGEKYKSMNALVKSVVRTTPLRIAVWFTTTVALGLEAKSLDKIQQPGGSAGQHPALVEIAAHIGNSDKSMLLSLFFGALSTGLSERAIGRGTRARVLGLGLAAFCGAAVNSLVETKTGTSLLAGFSEQFPQVIDTLDKVPVLRSIGDPGAPDAVDWAVGVGTTALGAALFTTSGPNEHDIEEYDLGYAPIPWTDRSKPY